MRTVLIAIISFLIFIPSLSAQSTCEAHCNILIMDSGFRDLVYNIDTWKRQETNAHDIKRLLAPKCTNYNWLVSTTTTSWKDHMPEITNQSPALIIINIDSFVDPFFVESRSIQETYFLKFLKLIKASGIRHNNDLPVIVYSNDKNKLDKFEGILNQQKYLIKKYVYLLPLENFDNKIQIKQLEEKVNSIVKDLNC